VIGTVGPALGDLRLSSADLGSGGSGCADAIPVIATSATAVLPTPCIAGTLPQASQRRHSFPDDGPIAKVSDGPTELRLRLGVSARLTVADHLEIDPEAAVEDVEGSAYTPGARRVNAVLRAAVVWRP
jgi:hypothetical protein